MRLILCILMASAMVLSCRTTGESEGLDVVRVSNAAFQLDCSDPVPRREPRIDRLVVGPSTAKLTMTVGRDGPKSIEIPVDYERHRVGTIVRGKLPGQIFEFVAPGRLRNRSRVQAEVHVGYKVWSRTETDIKKLNCKVTRIDESMKAFSVADPPWLLRQIDCRRGWTGPIVFGTRLNSEGELYVRGRPSETIRQTSVIQATHFVGATTRLKLSYSETGTATATLYEGDRRVARNLICMRYLSDESEKRFVAVRESLRPHGTVRVGGCTVRVAHDTIRDKMWVTVPGDPLYMSTFFKEQNDSFSKAHYYPPDGGGFDIIFRRKWGGSHFRFWRFQFDLNEESVPQKMVVTYYTISGEGIYTAIVCKQ